MRRRSFFPVIASAMTATTARPADASARQNPKMTLLNAPLELGGNWEKSALGDVAVVLERARAACLEGVDLRSDHQPEKLRVDDHASGPPSIWLHSENPTTAWIVVDVHAQDWCNLAYQFGHELGHVLCNSWQPDGAPGNPCQWVEESLVEAFSLRGLAHLAAAWETNPPAPGDNAYGHSIRTYRETIVNADQQTAAQQGMAQGFGTWFRTQQAGFQQHGSLTESRGAVPTMLTLLESNPAAAADLGALNRWPGRSSLPLADYLARWAASCAELGTTGILPAHIGELLKS
jgi:hypothetical protein